MIYTLHDNSITLQGGECGRALTSYRASASRLLGSSAWRVEPVMLDDGDGIPRSGFPRRVWTLDDEQTLPGVIGDAVFQFRHKRRFGPTDIMVILSSDISGVLRDSDPSGEMIRCAAHDIAAVAAGWAPMCELPANLPFCLSPVFVRLACAGLALGSLGRTNPREEQIELGTWGMEVACSALGGRLPSNEVVSILDIISRKSYVSGERLRSGVCPESLATIGAELVASCLAQLQKRVGKQPTSKRLVVVQQVGEQEFKEQQCAAAA